MCVCVHKYIYTYIYPWFNSTPVYIQRKSCQNIQWSSPLRTPKWQSSLVFPWKFVRTGHGHVGPGPRHRELWAPGFSNVLMRYVGGQVKLMGSYRF